MDGFIQARWHIDSYYDAVNRLQPLADEARPLLEEIMSLQSAVMSSTPHVVHNDAIDVRNAVSLEEIWESIDQRYESFSEYRDVALDRYHRQVMLQSGAVQRSSLKILHQGISAQVS